MSGRIYNDLWRTVPGKAAQRQRPAPTRSGAARCWNCRRRTSSISWRRPRRGCSPGSARSCASCGMIAQYFYPQGQTKVMNEGCATYCHYRIMNRLYEKGQINDGAMLEFLHSHTNVVIAAGLRRSGAIGGINPYALGFAMMQDIARIADEPTEEDRAWFPEHRRQRRRDGGAARRLGQLPRRELHPAVPEPAADPAVPRCSTCRTTPTSRSCGSRRSTTSAAIARIRRALARQYDVAWLDPDIQVVDVDLAGDRKLIVHHRALNRVLLDEERCALRAAAPRRPLGLRRAAEGDRPGERARCCASTPRGRGIG